MCKIVPFRYHHELVSEKAAYDGGRRQFPVPLLRFFPSLEVRGDGQMWIYDLLPPSAQAESSRIEMFGKDRKDTTRIEDISKIRWSLMSLHRV
jgi:hypothetical protein